MYESVEVGGLAPTPNPFLVVDFYNQNRACLLPEKGLPAPGPYSTPLRTPLWNGSNHCRYQPLLSYCRGGVGSGASSPTRGFEPGGVMGSVSTLHFPLSLAETWVPLLDSSTPGVTLGANSVILGLRNFGGSSLQETFVHLSFYILEGK